MTTRTLRSSKTATKLAGGLLRIGSGLFANGDDKEPRFRVLWNEGVLYLIPDPAKGVVGFYSNPSARSPLIALSSALRLQGVKWRDIPAGEYPAKRLEKAIAVDFRKANGNGH